MNIPIKLLHEQRRFTTLDGARKFISRKKETDGYYIVRIKDEKLAVKDYFLFKKEIIVKIDAYLVAYSKAKPPTTRTKS